MPYQEQDYGDSYVIQLKNSHFIVFDGGTNAETGRLIAYLETLVPAGETPVVDAWFISHAHMDHIGALIGMTRDEGYTERIYVEGIYFNEPGDEVLALADSSNAASYIQSLKRVVKQLKTTNGQAPAIYHPQAGQKYYFYGDVEIDVMFSQEWIAIEDYTRKVPFGYREYGPAGFNESSTWLMVHIPQGQKHYKFLSAADARMIGMTFAMGTTSQHKDAAFSKEYLKVNVMNAFHHALNLSYDFADYCELQDILLVTRKTIADVNNGQLTNYNNSANVDVYYYGQGTTVLTFTDTDIAVNQIAVPTE